MLYSKPTDIHTAGAALAAAINAHDQLRTDSQQSGRLDDRNVATQARELLSFDRNADDRAEFYTAIHDFALGALTSDAHDAAKVARVIADVLRCAFRATLFVHVDMRAHLLDRGLAAVYALSLLNWGTDTVLTMLLATGRNEAFELLKALLVRERRDGAAVADDEAIAEINCGLREIRVHYHLRQYAARVADAEYACPRMKALAKLLLVPDKECA